MTLGVTFRNLWLASENSRKGRKIDLSHSKTLLIGVNGTGKSRITKNIFWALGCEPRKRNAGAWDPDTIAALDFSLGDRNFTVLRAGKKLGLYDSFGRLRFSATNRSRWMSQLSELFSYRLTLQRPNVTSFRPAGLSYLTLPYYLDQDGSWGATWNTYADLSQFKNWRPPVFDAFTGLRPATYLEAKQRRTELATALSERQRELESQRKAFRRVRDELPKNLPSLDLSKFRQELAELASTAKKTQSRQLEFRAKLVTVVGEIQRLTAEIQLASGAHRELVEDLSYLSDIPDSTDIQCPTCGTMHKTSFHARLQLATDAESMASLVAELNKQLEKGREKESALRRDLAEVQKSLAHLESVSEERKSRLRLEDVLTAHSKKTIDRTFSRVTEKLQAGIDGLQDRYDSLNLLVKKFEDKARITRVTEYYQSQLRYLSDLLDIPSDERVDETRIGARPVSGGSSGPRAVLAVHLAMLASNIEHGDTTRFPFVVDTPQQSGQDEDNLRRMIAVLDVHAGKHHPLLLAVERLPEGADISAFHVIEFVGKQQLLRETEFDLVSDQLRQMLRDLKDASMAEDNGDQSEEEQRSAVSDGADV